MVKNPSLHAVEPEEGILPPVERRQPPHRRRSRDRSIAHGGVYDRRGRPARCDVRQAAEGHLLHRARGDRKPWQDRGFYFLLELKDRDPYIVAPAIAKLKKEEDVIRPVLMVRYVTMTGDEGLWALKIDPPDRKANAWNKSAMTVAQGRRRRPDGFG